MLEAGVGEPASLARRQASLVVGGVLLLCLWYALCFPLGYSCSSCRRRGYKPLGAALVRLRFSHEFLTRAHPYGCMAAGLR